MDLKTIERRIVVGSRFMSLTAVVGSLAGSVLMFFLGLFNIYRAFTEGLNLPAPDTSFGAGAVIIVIEGLDRFLIAIVLLYFAYGVYTLFVHPEHSEQELRLPEWLQVKQIGQLKQVVAEVIIVVLFVLFLRIAMEAFHGSVTRLDLEQIGTLLVLPVGIVLLALSLRLVQLHPKPSEDRIPPETPASGPEDPPGPEEDRAP